MVELKMSEPKNKTMAALKFPMPPSANALFRNVPGRGRVKTEKYKAYEREVAVWCMQNMITVNVLRDLILNMGKNEAITLEAEFFFHPYNIITKQGRPRPMDLDNRLKAMIDCFCNVIHINDCYVWKITSSKNRTTDQEHVDIILSLTSMF